MQSQFTIPVIDLNDYRSQNPADRSRFVEGVGSALKSVGFFALTNHGIDHGLIQSAYGQVAELFALDEATKKSYEIPEQKGQRGYTSFGKEHAKDSKAPDLKEFWHIGQDLPAGHPNAKVYPPNVWPAALPAFKPIMSDMFRRLENCALQILEACSEYAGETKDVMSQIAVDGNSVLRLIHYPPVPADRHPSSIRAAAHEDINLITLLIDATAPGLEILSKGQWVPVVTPPECIIVDAGDMLQNLTNGFYKSTTHRVTNPDNSRERRFSMPFFVHARSEVPLNPLPSCVARTGGQKTYPDITAGQYLDQRLREIGLA